MTDTTTTNSNTRRLYKLTFTVAEVKKNEGWTSAMIDISIKGKVRRMPATVFGKAHDTVARYLKVGKTVEVTGRLDGGVVRIHGRRPGTRQAEATKAAA